MDSVGPEGASLPIGVRLRQNVVTGAVAASWLVTAHIGFVAALSLIYGLFQLASAVAVVALLQWPATRFMVRHRAGWNWPATILVVTAYFAGYVALGLLALWVFDVQITVNDSPLF